ncbi:synaptonemal complex protein 1 isoform X2 [Gouania willdenowi]|uniref:synaptonemal complex protein 1 isoform X2 n=1 Tax=Gouania willdenowi TaxID=441366 RepID=UPI0010569ADF|nr:synaptonemal complex protein 1 isoform X2 [Gouania willdenowi]
MNRERGFSFKLLVPPRVSSGNMSAVRPQEVVESRGDFINAQGQAKCYDKDQNILFNTTPVVPTKPSRQEITKIKAVPPMEKTEITCNPGQVYSKLFNEVEKIKCWKVKVDIDTVQKERRLQDNKRTIESQRKAIQELQFVNESLSIKLEEQIIENEDLRNKNNATRNLCNILKETFEWSAEKMQLFESEREETHQLFVENSDTIKKLMGAFEGLHFQAEANKQEMQKVNESLLQTEGLKEKYYEGCKQKDEEITSLQIKHKDKDKELQNVILELDKTQILCRKLQVSTDQQFELLKSSKTEQESLRQTVLSAEQRCVEIEKNRDSIAAALEELKKEYEQSVKSKDLSLQELNTVRDQQAKQLEQSHITIEELKDALTQNTQRIQRHEEELQANIGELERQTKLTEEALEKAANEVKVIENLKKELEVNSNVIESMKAKIDVTVATVAELSVELSRKTDQIQVLKKEVENSLKENDILKKACEDSKKEKDSLKETFTLTELKVQELEGQLMSEKNKNKECTTQIQQLTGEAMQEKLKYEDTLSKYNELQSEKAAIQLQFEQDFSYSKALESSMKVSKEKAAKLDREIQRLKDDNRSLREELNSNNNGIQMNYQEAKTLQMDLEEKYEDLMKEISEKEKKINIVETKLCNLGKNIRVKLKSQDEMKKENKLLKKRVEKETAKAAELEKMTDDLHEESQNFKKLQEENFQKLLKDFEAKSALNAELEIEVQKFKMTTAEVQRSREDAELKCQQKIADMVALMEKHKSQYEKMLEEKDAELNEKNKKEAEAVIHVKSLELDISKQKTENKGLSKQMKVETEEKEKLQKALTDLKKEMAQLTQVKSLQSAASNPKQGRTAETLRGETASKCHVFDFSESWKTPSQTPSQNTKTAGSAMNTYGRTSKIKSYRIKTPPLASKQSQWTRSTIELDPKSDSSDPVDLLTFANLPTTTLSASHSNPNFFRKIASPADYESPRNSSKLAAIKRMRDAGWTAVIGGKKKKNVEKIFA